MLIAGVDEAGRGPLAGPVVVAAVILDPARIPPGITDSKALSASRRDQLFDQIMACAHVCVAHASVEEIDALNILQATFLAMRRAVAGLPLAPDHLLVDGNRLPRDLTLPAETLVKEGFQVMVYCADDPIQCKMLEEIGCVAVMPLASLIGSGMGIVNPWNLRLIIDSLKVPVLVDAGVGTASDATVAMELGCDGVLMNTAIAHAKNPVLMASAMKKAVEAGREAFLAGRMPRKYYSADPSSPTTGLIGS